MSNYPQYAILNESHEVVPVSDVLEWAKWIEKAERRVKLDILGKARVSTVFLGLNHNFLLADQPLWFETMIFGSKHDEFQNRCATWDHAIAMHDRAVSLVKAESA